MKVISSIVGGDDAAKDKAFGDGLYAVGTRFVMARAEDRSIYARSVRVPFLSWNEERERDADYHRDAPVSPSPRPSRPSS